MAKLPKVKCPVCDQKFFREEELHVEHKKRYYHLACYDKISKVDTDKDELYAYVIKLLELKGPGPRIYGQVKKYMDEYGYTYKGIHQALIYFYDIKKNTTEKSNGGIGIVPFVYAEAEKYFERQQDLQDKAVEIAAKATIQETKEIMLSRPRPTRPIHKNIIDITTLK